MDGGMLACSICGGRARNTECSSRTDLILISNQTQVFLETLQTSSSVVVSVAMRFLSALTEEKIYAICALPGGWRR